MSQVAVSGGLGPLRILCVIKVFQYVRRSAERINISAFPAGHSQLVGHIALDGVKVAAKRLILLSKAICSSRHIAVAERPSHGVLCETV